MRTRFFTVLATCSAVVFLVLIDLFLRVGSYIPQEQSDPILGNAITVVVGVELVVAAVMMLMLTRRPIEILQNRFLPTVLICSALCVMAAIAADVLASVGKMPSDNAKIIAANALVVLNLVVLPNGVAILPRLESTR